MYQTFTHLYRLLPLPAIIILLLLCSSQRGYAQCSETTPVFDVNLDGKPSGSWTSPEVNRDGSCCGADKNETCVQFNIILDDLSGGLQFDITSGPKPKGAMTYQINCGAPIAVGDSICVTGPGPHELSICMPGGASNTFTVTSIAAYEPVADANVTGGCSTTLNAPISFDPASVVWNDITGGGTYNSYLSCTSGCGTPTITPDANAPAFVDYTICGNSQSAVCTSLPYCDTIRVHFFPPIVASISPDPAIICPGSTGVDLSGSATGGSGNYRYFWFNEAGTLLANAQTYTATTIGTYMLEVRNENYPDCTPFTSSVTVTENLTANAGPDQEVCANETVQLAGAVTAATGGTWSGGNGTFSPDANDLNAIYTPTAGEAAAASLRLTLTSTGNGSCSPVSDAVLLSFHSFAVSITSPAVLCPGTTATLTANITGGTSPFTYQWSSGETSQAINNKPAGTYTVAVTDSKNCTFETSATILEAEGPSGFTAASSSSTCGINNGEIVISSATGGTTPYTYSKDGTTFQTANTFSGLLSGTYTISVKDAKGCTFAKEVVLEDIAGPTGFTASSTSSTCGEANGQIEISAVSGGTSPYTYAKDGTSFQMANTFSGLPANTYTITVKDANGCTFAKDVTLTNLNGPTAISASNQPASCADNDGSIQAGTVTGGLSPYTYSINGSTFQASTSFTALASGTYTLTAKDANGCTISTNTTILKVAPTDLTTILSASSCGRANGQIDVTAVSGGVAPYTYSKDGTTYQASNIFGNLVAGTYTISVKDAKGCTHSEGVNLSDQPGPTNVTLAQVPSSCSKANGQVNVTGVTGGTTAYTYSKDGISFQAGTNFNNLLAGKYTITVKDANGCTFAKDIMVEDVPGPTDITLAPLSSTCGNANAEISVSAVNGGSSPYTYSIDGTTFQTSSLFTGLAAGDYTITVKDANECVFSKATSLGNIPGPTNFTTTLTSSTCGNANGKMEVASITDGTAPFIYALNNGAYQGAALFTGLAAGTYTVKVKDANACVVSKTVTLNNIAGPTAVRVSSQPASCADNDGSIEAGTVTGGTSPYTYSIDGTTFQASTSFTALASGTYTITAKDANGCTISQGVTTSKLTPTDLTTTLTPSTCSGTNGAIGISTVSGGKAPYTYSLDGTNYQSSNLFSGLMASTYTIRVKDANGCIYSEGVNLTDQPGPTDLSLAQVPSSCSKANGQIDVTGVTGGTAAFTYSKDGVSFQAGTNFSNLLAGEYTITVKDANGCTFAKDITVEDVPGPTGLSASTTPATCSEANGLIEVTGTTGGTAPYTYSTDGVTFQESTRFPNILAGTYEVTVKDALGCRFTKTVTVRELSGPAGFTATTTSSTCSDANGQISISGVVNGTTPYSYSADGVNFQASSTLSGLLAGKYSIVVKDANGCSLSKEVALNDIAGPTAVNANSQPASCADNDGSIEVTSVNGGTGLYTYSIDGNTFQSTTSFTALASGTYTLTALDENGCTISSSIIVEKLGPADMAFTTQPSNCGASDGSFTISSVSGGLSPYTYSLDGTAYQASGTFSNLISGTYTAWVKDANGCTYSKEVSINDIGGATAITTSLKASTCGLANGAISITDIIGGSQPFTISLNGGAFTSSATFSDLMAGTYTIQVKDVNGCLYTQEVTLEDIAGPSNMTISTATTTCGNANGNLKINTVSGGTAPYTYSIDGTNFQASESFGALSAATYTVTVRDFWGCTYVEEAVVTDIAGPTDMGLSSTTTTCSEANGSITVEGVTGGSEPYAYSIDGLYYQNSTTFQELMAGTYEVTVKDLNGCLWSESITITDIAGPSAANIITQPTTCANNEGTIEVETVTGGTSPFTYSIDGTNFQSEITFPGLASGEYSVVTKDANGCTLTTVVIIERIEPTDLLAVNTSSTCGNSNGEITISGVTGGASPYTYSIGGFNYQVSPGFTGLVSGTYTMLVKDANGCIYSEQVVLEDIPGPTGMEVSLGSSSCGRNNGSITLSGVTGGTSPYTYSIGGKVFQDNATFTNLLAGNYTLTVKDANGCIFIKEAVLEDIAGPAGLALTATSSSCSNANGAIEVIEVTGGTNPYTYSIDGTTFQSESSFGNLLAGIYEVTVKDANGCTYSKEGLVEDIAGPDGLEASSTPASCGQADGSITAGAVKGGTPPYTYSLNGGAYQIDDPFNGIAAGNHLLRVKDAKGCVFEKAVQVNNTGGPTDLIAIATAAICNENNGTITVDEVSGTTGPYTYSIDGIHFQASANFTGLNDGTYSLSVKDINGCLYLEEVVVNDESGASAISAATTTSSCTIDNGTITVETVSGGIAPYSYSLDGESYQSRTGFSGLAAATYTIYVKDANACVTTFEETIITSGPQSAETMVTNASCGESDGSISVGTVTGGTAPFTYSIDGINFQSSTEFTGLSAGSYLLSIKDEGGCILELPTNISNDGGPEDFTTTLINASCGNSNGRIVFGEPDGGTAPYTYSIDATIYREGNSFSGLVAGDYQLSVKDANGCLLFKTATLSDTEAPTAFRWSSAAASCGLGNGSLTVESVTGGISPYTYSIDGFSFQESATFSGLVADTYTLYVKDRHNCTYSETVTIEGIDGPADMQFSSINASCESNGEVHVEEVSGGTTPYIYSLDGAFYQSSPDFINLQGGNYTLHVADANNCVITAEVFIEEPAVSLLYTRSISCNGAMDGEIALIASGTASKPQFSIDGGATFQADSIFSELPEGEYSVLVKFSESCTKEIKTLQIHEPDSLFAVATPTGKVIGAEVLGSAELGKMSGGSPPYTFAIDNGEFGEDSVFTQLTAGEHIILMQDAAGCTTPFPVFIEQIGDIEIPNGFTPNGDGINDYWALKNVAALYPDCQVAVFNRWGQEIFKSRGYAYEWDGSHKGKTLPDGTYYYVIQLNGTEAPLKGAVTIMR